MAINLVMHASLDLNSNLIVFSYGFLNIQEYFDIVRRLAFI
jgi:hypothetical protein